LFSHQSPAGTSRYLVTLGKKQEEHKSSGVWISTPTGSTAAIRSAGGAPMALDKANMQFAVRELFPEAKKKFYIQKGILAPSQKITFIPKMRQAGVFIDGNHIMIPLNYGDKVEVSAKGKPLKAIL
jgi:NAD+ kinase